MSSKHTEKNLKYSKCEDKYIMKDYNIYNIIYIMKDKYIVKYIIKDSQSPLWIKSV